VLSIGKLSAGQAKYYLEQGEVRVDAIESIGDGLEEYYAGGAEARGTWIGSGGKALGPSGPVEGDALRRVLAGLDPQDGSPLRGSLSAVKVAGFDLTFSAPKSVSVLFGIGNRELRAAVRAAHDRAVLEAVGYLERSAAAVRRGHGGAEVVPAAGLVAAAFRHGTSRAGDPQLHTHVLVANLGRGPDGRWSALDGRRLYAHARAASFIYQAVLRAELTRTLGVEWLPVCNGIAELVGVPKPMLRPSVAGASRSRRPWRSAGRQVRARPKRLRWPPGRPNAVTSRSASWSPAGGPARPSSASTAESSSGCWAGSSRPPWTRRCGSGSSLSSPRRPGSRSGRRRSRAATSSRPCASGSRPARRSTRAIEAATDRFLASSHAVALLPTAGEGEAYRRADGRLLPIERDALVYSTPELLALSSD
jgi:conjugative relaxase-like TrwC/TraI family protein